MQSDQMYYFTTIGLQFQQTCLLILSPSASFVPGSPLGRGETFSLPCQGGA